MAVNSTEISAELNKLPQRIAEKVQAGLKLARWIDLVLHLPMRYQDEATLSTFENLVDKANASLIGTVVDSEIIERPRRQLVAKLAVDGGEIQLRWLHFYPNQQSKLSQGSTIKVTGIIRKNRWGWEIIHPKIIFNPKAEEWTQTHSKTQKQSQEKSQEQAQKQTDTTKAATAADSARLTPVYPSAAGIGQTDFTRWLKQAPEAAFEELLPSQWLNALKLPNWCNALQTLHGQASPNTEAALNNRSHPAWQRIKFEELLAQQLALKQARQHKKTTTAPVFGAQPNPILLAAQSKLPFSLTQAQSRVLNEILQDLALPHPMQRLLQGDVGSGKTAVAALACAQAIGADYQTALMAPTEILAEQHFKKLHPLYKSLGLNCELLTGSTGKKEKRRIEAACRQGGVHIVIGTHALIESPVQFAKLGLVIIDEQHRFGVQQRLALLKQDKLSTADHQNSALMPHQLMMSATPIPRTLSQTYLSDLDVSNLDEKPPGRQPIITKLVSQKRREDLYRRLQIELTSGKQAYWVCPLIEESETLQLQAAEQTYAEIQNALPQANIRLLHGRMNSTEKTDIMAQFQNQTIQLLVSTTVIEVGVDVPNASLMVIEHAERFGLAQLHQLRGRVGRGKTASVCVLLFGEPLSWTSKQRLKAMKDSNDGFYLAEKDLQIRGPGELLGKRQSGLPMLKYADPLEDKEWVKLSRKYANLIQFEEHRWAQRLIERWFVQTDWWLS